MADPARVHSLEALRDFRTALIKFADEVREALVDVDADINKARQWVETEAKPGWARRLQKSKDDVNQAKAAVQRKQVYAASPETAPSAVDEKKALDMARKRVEKSEEKLRNVGRWSRQLEKEIMSCRGQTQMLARVVEVDVPMAVALLDRLMDRLHEYLNEAPTETRAAKMAQYWRGTELDPDDFNPQTDTPFKNKASDDTDDDEAEQEDER